MDPTEKSSSKAEFAFPLYIYFTRNYSGKKLALKSKKLLSKNNSFLMLNK